MFDRAQPVHPRHSDVHQDDRKVSLFDRFERFFAGIRPDQLRAERIQDGFKRNKVGRTIIDHQDAGGRFRRSYSPYN
jgi:hypothetical protein